MYVYVCIRTWWAHQMETFSVLLAFLMGIHQSPVNSPHKGQWRGAMIFSLICAWINGWAIHRGTGNLRRHRGHYDVIVMILPLMMKFWSYHLIASKCFGARKFIWKDDLPHLWNPMISFIDAHRAPVNTVSSNVSLTWIGTARPARLFSGYTLI